LVHVLVVGLSRARVNSGSTDRRQVGARAADLTKAEFGVASTSPTPVPLPAGLPLLLAALGGFAVMRRKRAA